MKYIYIFPKYTSKAPSSRYRFYSYVSYYEQVGIKYEIFPLLKDWYLECIWSHRSVLSILHLIVAAYIERFCRILFLSSDCIVYTEAELFPYFPHIAEWYLRKRKIKYIAEYDDAIFHVYDQSRNALIRYLFKKKIMNVMKEASYVIVGCQYLFKYAQASGAQNVVEIPTSIDADKYFSLKKTDSNKFVIGWIGSYPSSRFIKNIIPALRKLNEEFSFELHLVGFDPTMSYLLESIDYKIIKWREETEIDSMKNFSVGIMPLDDTLFSQGKCAFKLVQYMGIGIPTISTPLLSNVNIDKGAGNLFAYTVEEWYECMLKILQNREHFNKVGMQNREIAMKNYTFQVNKDKYIKILQTL